MFLSMIHGIPNHTHTCHSLLATLARKSKYTINHPRTHSDFRSRDSGISIAWEILMTNNHVVFSWADRSKTPFSNMFYVLWLTSHIPWPVKRDHLTEYILVLVYCHFYDNNRLETFRIVFFYASRFYYINHAFDNSGRITIHGRFIKLNMHRNNKMIKQCLIKYISNIKSGYNVLGLGLTLTRSMCCLSSSSNWT